MERAEIFKRVRNVIATHLGADLDRVTEDANLIDDLDADSLDMIELQMAFDAEFDVQITDHEVGHLGTVGDVVALIESKVKAA